MNRANDNFSKNLKKMMKVKKKTAICGFKSCYPMYPV